MIVAEMLVSFALVDVDHCGVSELLGELLLVPERLKEQVCSNDGERPGGLRSVDRFKSILTPLGVMPLCKALNLVCFGIEPGVLQRAEFCLCLIVQVDEGSLFLLGRRGRSGGLKVCDALPSVVHGLQGHFRRTSPGGSWWSE